jgi:hypothetical protein
MDSIDLDVNNYTLEEMEDFLSLSKDYNISNINIHKTDLQTKIMNDSSVKFTHREDISTFIDQISSLLEDHWKNEQSAQAKPEKFSELTQRVTRVDDHYLIEPPNLVERYSQDPTSGIIVESGAPPGIVNPVKYKTIKKSINIDSRFRPNYYQTSSSDLHITLPERIDNVTKMMMVSMELPLSFYTISKGLSNNTFTIQYVLKNEQATIKQITVTLADGNYQVQFVDDTSAKSIEVGINEALRASIIGPDPTKPLFPEFKNLRYSVDKSTCKSIFAFKVLEESEPSATQDDILYWGIIFNVDSSGGVSPEAPAMFRLGWLLGYRVSAYYTSSYETCVSSESGRDDINITENGAFVSEGICYPKGPNYIYISIDDFNNNSNNYFKAIYNESINNNNIFARINLASIITASGIYSVGGDDSFSTSLSRSREYFGPVNIQKLRITLYDEYGRNIILNNMDWSLSLMFECIYS